ncbi:hypothetical protein COU55_00180 [Candidatus Pacearchaeota archaeon CG10_big_fil_rev_8_21_14_0_10_31_59]|nr:MAG: hypothetical protein COU55_00180 [Candidatus Pacearchaeota archaeon CG10_big_fil_rev_8_21_14_0_10_31_59]
MAINKELINKVRADFGLNIYEAKVWLALLAKGIATAGEIAEISGVPRSRTYDVLESLERDGFTIPKLGKPIKYIAIKPELVIERIKRNVETNSNSRIELLNRVKETDEYKELLKLHNSRIEPVQREDLSGALKGRSSIHEYLREMIENAKIEIIMATTTEALDKKMKFLKLAFQKLKKHGIKIRISASGEIQDIKRISTELGILIRPIKVRTRFYIIDREQILFMLTQEVATENDVGVWINSKYFALALANLYDIAYSN